MNEIGKFCKDHNACREGTEWAKGKSRKEIWETAKPGWLIWIVTRKGFLAHKDCVRFACFCARQNWDKLKYARSRKAVEVAEAFVQGKATKKEAAANAADANAADAAAYAAYAAAAAYAANSADAAAAYAAYAAYAAIRLEQAKWIRDNYTMTGKRKRGKK